MTPGKVREDDYAAKTVRVAEGGELAGVESLKDLLAAETELVILFGDAIKGDGVRKLVAFGDSLGIPVKYVPLVDYSNSRGAYDTGLIPGTGGLDYRGILNATDLDVVWGGGAPIR